ncbi:MAG: S53 family peptidase, partial [Bdellovibrionia bacterium]
MIYKGMLISSVFISLCLGGCKDINWKSGNFHLRMEREKQPSVTCIPPAATPNDSDPFISHLVVKNNARYKPSAKPLQRLNGIVPAAVKEANDKGEMSSDKELSISIAMRPNREIELDRLLKELYNPKNPKYHKFITPDQFVAKFGPTEKQVEQVKNLLKQNGFKSVSADDNRLLVHAKGNVAAVNQVFHTEVHSFKDKAGKAFYAPSFELQVPRGFAIRGVHGLDNSMTWKSQARRLNVRPFLGPEGGFTPVEINAAYSIPKGLTGAGQTIALFELDGYDPADILAYEKAYGISPVPLRNILVDGATGKPGNAALEVVLDIELITAVAPGAKELLIYEGGNTSDGVLSTYNRIANDNLAKIVSVSWGSSEISAPSSFIQSESIIFKQMAAQGQAVYVASGDNGAYDDQVNLGVNDPSSQPYVVAVGGTQLTTKKDGSYDSETTWNTDGGGGGGISEVWTIPSYQIGVANDRNQVSPKMRNVPDVALNADP